MRNFKKICAGLSAFALTAGTLTAFPASSFQSVSADAVYVSNDFDISYEGWCNLGEQVELTADEQNPHEGTRSMHVSNRLSADDGVSSAKGFYLWGGRKYDYKVFVKHESGQDENFKITLSYLLADETTWETAVITEEAVTSGEWTEIGGSFKAPEGATEFVVKITTDSTCDFNFDDFTVSGKKYTDNTVSAASGGLKDAFGKYFRVGNIFNGNTVKNSALQALALQNYNSIECENETKPDHTLVQNGSTDTDIKVTLNSCASIFDFCAKNGIGVRGHTLVWHSQTPQWFFKEGFNANGAWVNSSTMDKRMESYIKNMFAAIQTQYPNLDLYAYDVCNECISDDANRTGSKDGSREPGYNDGKSPWVQVYGSNAFIEKAFTYARQYAPASCKLYYNDYNEYWDHKRDCIYKTCKSLYDKGVLDGVGMQSHINANQGGFSGTTNYVNAMKKFLSIGCDVQVTELDISVENGTYSYQQQANKYKDVFQAAIDCNESGQYNGRVTAVCIWGPNDANSWLSSGSNGLIFDGNNQPKAAYNTLMSMVPESEWQPYDGGDIKPREPKEADSNGYYEHFDMESSTSGFSGRGGATVESSSDYYKGSKGLSCSGRTAEWNGIQYSLDSFTFKAGEEYSFAAAYKGKEDAEFKMTLQYSDGTETQYAEIASAATAAGSWVMLSNSNYKIPAGASDLTLVFETTDSSCDFSIDEVILAKAGTKVDGPKGQKTVGNSKVKGDLDGDEKISVADLVLLKSGILNGFSSKAAQSNGDVDNSSETNAEDALNLQKYLLGTLSEFPDNTPPEPPKSQYNYNSAISFKEAPGNYFNSCQQAGKVTKETYNGINGSNSCLVYTPYGYDSSKKYNILYLMHGGGENETTIFQDSSAMMANMFDHMIMNGELEPLIVVCPTFNKCTAQTFYKEWMQSLIPFVEGKYSTYAASTSAADIKASRFHRAYGGFSMGACSTWAGMVHGGLDICAYWLPLSGDNWEADGGYGKAKSVADAIDNSGLKKNEYFIMCATGSEDIAYPNMNPQIDEMKKMSQFVYSSDFSQGNFYYLVASGKTHWWGYVRHYVYDVLPSFFHEGQ